MKNFEGKTSRYLPGTSPIKKLHCHYYAIAKFLTQV